MTSIRRLILLFVILVPAGLRADSGLPFVGTITVNTPGEVSLLCYPDGSGDAFTTAQAFGGATVDATINVFLIDLNGDPIANFPFEDIWLETEAGTEYACSLSALRCDSNTDFNGRTYFAAPRQVGGFASGPIWVYLNGNRASHPQNGELPPLALRFNSTDLNADGAANMVDLVTFAGDFHGAYNYRSDFLWDGVINLSDITKFVIGLGRSCP